MYKIRIHETPTSKLSVEYTIGGNLIVFARDTRNEVTGEWESFDVGLSVKEFIRVAKTIMLRKLGHKVGIAPPEYEHGEKQMGYCDRDDD